MDLTFPSFLETQAPSLSPLRLEEQATPSFAWHPPGLWTLGNISARLHMLSSGVETKNQQPLLTAFRSFNKPRNRLQIKHTCPSLRNLHHVQLSRLCGLSLEVILWNSTITVLVLGHKRDPIIHTAQYKPQELRAPEMTI